MRLTGRLLGGREARAFECSGYYLFHPLAAQRLAAELPDAQVVVLVRDPVERAMSAHRHELARGFEDLPLDEALARESERLAGEAERLAAEPDYRSYAHRHHGYLARGEYGEQIARFVDALGPDRVHVVDADALFADPVHEFVDLQRRLDVPVHLPERVEQWNARPGGARLPVADGPSCSPTSSPRTRSSRRTWAGRRGGASSRGRAGPAAPAGQHGSARPAVATGPGPTPPAAPGR